MALYDSADGESWNNNTNWLSGAPCTDGWHGVVCCPDSHPRLQSLDTRVCENDQGEPTPEGFAARQTWPLGCASGSATGTSIDRERCGVVGLALRGNGLDTRDSRPDWGRLSADLGSLQAVDLRDNDRLRGFIPSWVSGASEEVRLGVNDFDYDGDDGSLVSLFTRCRTDQGLACEGLPPLSCRAFGDNFAVALEDPSKCVGCGTSLVVPIAVMAGLLLLFVACLVGYIRLVHRYPDAIRKGVSTASLLIGHAQTVSILTSLKLSWPSSVLETQRWVSFPVNFLDLGATRPECVFGSVYYTFQIGRVWSVIVLLLSVSVVQSLLKRSHRRGATRTEGTAAKTALFCGKPITAATWDSFELAETIVFQFQFFAMLRAILGLVDSFNSRDDGAEAAALSALLLLLLEVGLVVKYLLNVRALVTGRTVGRFARLSADRLKLRMRYLTRRFADHAPYWQFVVWSRQLLLAIDAWLTRSMVVEATNGNTTATADPSNATTSDDAHQGVSVSGDSAVVLWHAVVAVVFLVVYAAVHVKVQPYAYPVQNTLETWLFVSDVMFVSLGIGYSFMHPQDPNREVVEPLLVSLLLGTLVLAAVYLSWHHRRYLRQEVTEITERAMTLIKTISDPRKRERAAVHAEHARKPVDISEAAVEISTPRQSPRRGSGQGAQISPGSDRTSFRGFRADDRRSLVSAGI